MRKSVTACTDESEVSWWTKMYKRSLQTAYRPCSMNSQNAQRTRRCAVQTSCNFICCSGMQTETTRCGK